MEIPPWFRQAMHGRLDKVSAQVEYHPEVEMIRLEEDRAFHAMFAGAEMKQIPAYAEWEDKHHLRQALMNEKLYLKSMKDGIQLAMVLLQVSEQQEDDE